MGSRMEKKVTIVIPNYNGKRFLDDCLSSLERQTSKDFETLVIDNASQDDSVSYIREHYPWVKIAVMRHNLGFSGGVNVGIGMCTTPYVLLLNNDTRSFPKMVEELIKTMESADDIFSVSCKMIQFHDHEKMDDAGDLYTCLGWAFQRGVGQPVGDYREPAEVFSACAGAAGTYSAQSPSSITIAWNEDKENTRFEENLERIITQKWIAMFPLGIEAWCEHRRTGYPKFLPIMDNKGVGITNLTLGIRRLSYPAEEYQLNAENMLGALRKLNGEDNGATRLWWDCNPNVK